MEMSFEGGNERINVLRPTQPPTLSGTEYEWYYKRVTG